MKIYTKKGDEGQTSLCNGQKVCKSDLRVAAYGTIDELNAFVGDIRANIDSHASCDFLKKIQTDLFVIGGILAITDQKHCSLEKNCVQDLEDEIDRLTAGLPELKNFVYPGESMIGAKCAIARTVCRRAERAVVIVTKADIDKKDKLILQYLNRLSDYFFTLERAFNRQDTTWNRQ
ncbi:cob(I)yrinic acid a,c-diamide adenosyltransferase [Patescibacteria group bacterium]|nr:cob(I)yrinic acid a,c-diamide adenosyltransferase [Patescibacteria group bacterium]